MTKQYSKLVLAFALVALISVNFFIKDEVTKLYILIATLVIFTFFSIQNFLKDKREGKSLTRYYVALVFVLLAIAIAFYTYYSI